MIGAIGPMGQLDQLRLSEAASAASVKRFVLCGFITIAPRGDVMLLREEEKIVHAHIFRAKLAFTIIDVGYWHQLSWPSLPSGKTAYANVIPRNEIDGAGMVIIILVASRQADFINCWALYLPNSQAQQMARSAAWCSGSISSLV